MKTKAVIYKTDGQMVAIEPQNGKYFTLSELQDAVGGYVELIATKTDNNKHQWHAYADEDGKLRNRPYNALASALFRLDLVGDILFTPAKYIQ